MDYSIYAPTITTSMVINPYNNAASLKYTSETSMAYYGDKYWAVCVGSPTSYSESAADQHLYLTNSSDGQTWTTPVDLLRDSSLMNSVITGTANDNQPGLVVVGTELWCVFLTGFTLLAKLTSPTGKWTLYRFEFDGEQPFLSTQFIGVPTSGRSRTATIDGLSDWLFNPTGDPVILSSGKVVVPGTLLSPGSTFFTAPKYNALLITADNGATWTMTRINSMFPIASAWEPFVVENAAGHIHVFSRNLVPDSENNTLLVATSTDGGQSFTPSRSTRMQVATSRGSSRAIGTRQVMLHNDASIAGGVTGRQYGSIFTSLRGINDFVPGVSFTEFDQAAKYPQMTITPNGDLWVNWSSGTAQSNTVGVGRTGYALAKISPAPTSSNAYVLPRQSARKLAISDPALVTGTNPYYRFDGYNRIVSASAPSVSTALTFAAWYQQPYDQAYTGLADTRQGFTGALWRNWNLTIQTLVVPHGFTIPTRTDVFQAAVVDGSAKTITQYLAYGQSDFITQTTNFQSLLFTGQPNDGDTVTVDGTTWTFKTSATGSQVQIGATADATATNLKTKLAATLNVGVNVSANPANATRVLIARNDGASFSVSESASNVDVESAVSLAGGVANFGCSAAGSSVGGFCGFLYGARLYGSALSVGNMRNIYNANRSAFGWSSISGTSTAPASPLLSVDPSSPDAITFPAIGGAHRCEVVNSTTLRVYGNASAGVELPYGATQVTIRWKLSATPASGDKYVIATFGDVTNPVRLYVDSSNPNSLYANGSLVAPVSAPTQWTTTTVVLTRNKVQIGSWQQYFSGPARCFLGDAYPTGTLLNPAKYVDVDVASMKAGRA